MVDSILEYRREFGFLLSSLKSSIERYTPPHRLFEGNARDAWKNAALHIESIRIDYASATRPRLLKEELFEAAIVETRSSLRSLLEDNDFIQATKGVRFRSLPMPTQDRVSGFRDEGAFDVPEAIKHIIDYSYNLAENQLDLQSSSNIVKIKRIVPGQKIAPAQFDIVDARIIIRAQPAHFDPQDRENIKSARDVLIRNGDALIDQLNKSNCDRRLLESVKDLQEGLRSSDNIIQLGIMNIGCEAICDAFECELPDAIKGIMRGQTTGVGMLVAQFPEWQIFSEKAASININAHDIAVISNTAKNIVSDLERRPEIADPMVPKTISALQSLINDPATATKRAAFALLRTIENLISKTFQYTSDFIDKTISKTVEGLSTSASKLIIASLMSVALAGAASLTPIASKVSDTAWIKKAAELVRAQIETAD